VAVLQHVIFWQWLCCNVIFWQWLCCNVIFWQWLCCNMPSSGSGCASTCHLLAEAVLQNFSC